MNPANPAFGLVLTGGGAKGAYQAGALTYLAEIGIEPSIIAGTSIGALNGAVLASSAPFHQSVNRLNKLWAQLGQAPILRPNTDAFLHSISFAAQVFIPTLREWVLNFSVEEELLKEYSSIYDPTPIEEMLRVAVNPSELRRGIELWVTVFPSLKIPGLHYDCLIDLIRARTGTNVHWLCAQDCKDDDTLYNLLLASAALPLAFPRRKVNSQFYVDGGLADNIPIRALIKRGCNHVIVIHLEDGSAWNRHDFPEQTVIEIRPERQINKSDIPIIGCVDSLLDFSAERIADLRQRGYEDAKHCLKPIIQTLIGVCHQRKSHNSLIDTTLHLLNDSPL